MRLRKKQKDFKKKRKAHKSFKNVLLSFRNVEFLEVALSDFYKVKNSTKHLKAFSEIGINYFCLYIQ